MSISSELAIRAGQLYSSGKPVEALSVCSEALQLDPDDHEALDAMAGILLAEGRQAEAVPHLRKLAYLQTSRVEPLRILAALQPQPKWRGMKDGALVMGFPCWTVGYPFYSLMVVAGIAESAGIAVHIADFNVRFHNLVSETDKALWSDQHADQWMPRGTIPGPLFLRYAERFEAEIVAAASEREYGMFLLTVNMSTRHFTERAISILKARFPDVPLLLGGVDCFPLEWNRRFLCLDTPPDVICQGEAENALPAFLAGYAAAGDLPTNVPGFAGFSGGTFFDTGEPPLPNLKESILPSLKGIDFTAYQQPGSFPIFSSRGCVNRCTFCSESPNFKRFRFRRAEQTFAEIRHVYDVAVQYNPHPTMHFADSLINGSIRELEKLCHLIIDAKISVSWGGQAFFRQEMTADLLALMHRAGCVAFFWGLESGSQHVVDLMRKKYSLDVAMRIIDDCHRIGIRNYLPLVIGFPGETPVHLAETARFIDRCREQATFLDPNQCCVRPNSPLHARFSEYGLTSNQYTSWTTADMTNTPVIRATRHAIIRAVLKGQGSSRSSIIAELEAFKLSAILSEVAGEIDAFLRARKTLAAASGTQSSTG
jgi:anaerobic magnesium-protoporphyrin IX monomethyl ester cyclase